MNVPVAPAETRRVWHPIHCMAGALAALAALVALTNAFYLSRDIGTDGWWPGAMALCLVSTGYLLASALDHLSRARRALAPPRAEPWLSILILVLGWFVLARGPSSRLLLAGLSPTIAALSAAGCISLVVHIRERLVLSRPIQAMTGSWPLAAWRCALAAGVLLGVMILESRPLPAVKPWEARRSTQVRLAAIPQSAIRIPQTLTPFPEFASHRTNATRMSEQSAA